MAKPASSPSSGIAALARRRRPVHGRQVKLLPSLRSGSCQDNAVQNSCVVTAGCDQHEAVPYCVVEWQRPPEVKGNADGIEHAPNAARIHSTPPPIAAPWAWSGIVSTVAAWDAPSVSPSDSRVTGFVPALVNLADLDRMRGADQEGAELLKKAR